MRGARKDWAEIAAAWERSGELQRDFASRHGVAVETLRSWIYRRRREHARPRRRQHRRTKLVEMRVAAPVAASLSPVELALPNGMALRVVAGTDAAWVSSLAKALLA